VDTVAAVANQAHPRPTADLPTADLAGVVAHYEHDADESSRLSVGPGRLEFARTQEVIRRHLPAAPVRVLDVGGGTGVHAMWLAGDGHHVELVDPVPRHVAAAALLEPVAGSIESRLGDARRLDAADDTYGAVLLLGPLYHLQERADRLRALQEAGRVLEAGGLVFAAAISRFASLHDGLSRGFLFDEDFRCIVERDLETGRHENAAGRAGWFTTAYFHRPDELREEIEAAGLTVVELLGLEGLAGWLPQLEGRWAEPADRELIVWAARLIESEPTLLGLSAHLLAVARRP
jgi:SAM-dependent methyltransferase